MDKKEKKIEKPAEKPNPKVDQEWLKKYIERCKERKDSPAKIKRYEELCK